MGIQSHFPETHIAVMAVSLLIAGFSPEAKSDQDSLMGGSTVRYVTVRNHSGKTDPAKFYGDERSSLKAGYCKTVRSKGETLNSLAENSPVYMSESIFELESLEEENVDTFLAEWESEVGTQKPILFTHGYFVSFERGCQRASIFQTALELEDRLIHFSWPSDGNLLNYTRDEADAYWSAKPFTNILEDMIRRFGVGNVSLVAHSLGSRVNFYSLLNLASNHEGDQPQIDTIILIAPDMDGQIFAQYLPKLRNIAKSITVYVSGSDKPLKISRQLHGYPRLGEPGKHLESLEGVEFIDVTNLPSQKLSGHMYHLHHELVVSDLKQLIHEGKTASQRTSLIETGSNTWKLQ